MSVALRVLATGPLCLVEDLGRPGHSAVGVGCSGAADRTSYLTANRALGNPDGAAALEVTLGGVEVEVVGGHLWCCVSGAPAPVRVADREVGPYAVFAAPPGAVVRLGTPPSGVRSYLAVRGGVSVPPVLGSRSHDVLAGLGPPPVEVGDLLPVGPAPERFPAVDTLAPARPVGPLRVVRGPRDDWVDDADALVATTWRVGGRSDRVGMRLAGSAPGLRLRYLGRQLPSEGVWRGALQVPPGGEPVLLLADHPVTGGYPVVAVVVDADVDRAAQLRPGEPVRFRWV